ncbi:hypothetical protein [Helicobacter pylori]|nr:hypothetical protein [Helicobacter pylori]UOR33066.1 hypothetical protein MPG68_04805 [Helicobacter pylori]
MKIKPHPPSQKDKSFSLGTFGTHTASFKRFCNLNDSMKKENHELP